MIAYALVPLAFVSALSGLLLGLWLLLLSLGFLNEGRANARQLEYLRLFVVVPLLLWLLHESGTSLDVIAWSVAGLYVLGSAMWLTVAPIKQPIKT